MSTFPPADQSPPQTPPPTVPPQPAPPSRALPQLAPPQAPPQLEFPSRTSLYPVASQPFVHEKQGFVAKHTGGIVQGMVTAGILGLVGSLYSLQNSHVEARHRDEMQAAEVRHRDEMHAAEVRHRDEFLLDEVKALRAEFNRLFGEMKNGHQQDMAEIRQKLESLERRVSAGQVGTSKVQETLRELRGSVDKVEQQQVSLGSKQEENTRALQAVEHEINAEIQKLSKMVRELDRAPKKPTTTNQKPGYFNPTPH